MEANPSIGKQSSCSEDDYTGNHKLNLGHIIQYMSCVPLVASAPKGSSADLGMVCPVIDR